MASVKMMKASPVPDALFDSSSSRLHFSCGSVELWSVLILFLRTQSSKVAVALNPMIENTTTPANL